MARKKSAVLIAFSRLEEVILSARGAGLSTIPSERVLTERFQLSRPTVRKAIGQAVERKLLRKEKNVYLVCEESTAKETILVGVVAEGNVTPRNHVFARVLQHLSQLEGESCRVRIKPFLFDYVSHENPDWEELRECDAVIFLNPIPWGKSKDFLTECPCIIAVEESIADPRVHIVRYDDFKAGWMAADYLLRQGARRLCHITRGRRPGYSPFLRRAEGFVARLEQDSPTPHYEIHYLVDGTEVEYLQDCQRIGSELADSACEGVFFYADAGLATLLDPFERKRHTPKFITIFADGDMNQTDLPVAYLDHAEERIARQAIRTIERVRAGCEDGRFFVYAAPELYRD